MKRVLLSITATVIGVVALLSFKTHGSSSVSGGVSSLPSASLPSAAGSDQPSSLAPISTSAPPDPSVSTPVAPRGANTTPPKVSTVSAPRTFLGSSVTTRYGVVQVQITVDAHRISNVAFAKLTAFDGRSQQINQDAAPTLLQETLSAQSAHIDTVSGATYTSDGYITSLQSALDQAGL
jgi:uncharacterized protein with FMN-binding domain